MNRNRVFAEWVTVIGAALVASVGGIVLAAWFFDLHFLKSLGTGLATMKANTALALLLAGSGLLCLRKQARAWRVAGRWMAAAVTLIGAATLGQYVLGISVGIDQLLFSDIGNPDAYPGRPAPTTAASLLLAGAGLLCFQPEGGRRARFSTAMAAAVIAGTWVALTGYVYDVEALYRVGAYSSMAVHTALMLFVLGVAILAGQPMTGLTAIAMSDTAGGALVRRLIPVFPALFFALGWVWLAGERMGLFGESFGMSLMVLSITAISIAILAWYAVRIHKADLSREAAETEATRLRAALADRRFEALLESAPDGMVIANQAGTIVLVNARAQEMFGYQREELLGQHVERLVPERFREAHVSHRGLFAADPRRRLMGANRDLVALRKDGSEFAVEVSLSPLSTDAGLLVSSAIRDVTDRKAADLALKASLEEKDTLFREVHHRVKNNLAVMSSLFYLESTYAKDPETVRFLEEARNRVQSMATVHETLYRSSSFAHLDFGEYLSTLLPPLLRAYSLLAGRVTVHTESDPAHLSIEAAVPCALIVNELVTNCLKHAFPGDTTGQVRVSLRRADGRYSLCVRDTGVGISPTVDPATTQTLGLRLVRTLVRQLGGEFTLRPAAPGTEATVVFPFQESA